MKIIGIILLALITRFAHGQYTNPVSYDLESLKRQMQNTGAGMFDTKIEGTPYMTEKFLDATFYQKNSTIVKGQTRLNLFRGNFEFELNKEIYFIDETTMDSVEYDGKMFVFLPVEISGVDKLRVVQKIDRSGNLALYKLQETELQPEILPGAYVDAKPARFEPKEPIYIYAIDSQLVPLTSFKNLYASFPGKESEIKNFIKKNKIKKDDKDDLISLLVFLAKR